MGVFSCSTMIASSIPAAKAFEAIVNANNLISGVLMPVLKSAEFVEEFTSIEGNRDRTVKHKVEALDNENFTYCYSITEGDALGTTFEMITYEAKITMSPEGGSVCKNTIKYFAKNDVDITEEKIMAVKEKASALSRAIEAYLVANPHV
ncbi:major strawberry allergen Fra a 1.06-like [Eucalyptus grandis]|uniref:major strawberry allergen Fra a 1.06-like n=1 Tax=Eucalyptus grandis TaxID=71139 RepID=UPI00192ED9DE|nr:major strawberry allergen Fra a 1.06-like [Eucalyptus grandis]